MCKQKQQIYDRICPYCEIKFKNIKSRVYANHVRWCTMNKTNGDKGLSKLANTRKQKTLQVNLKEFNVICHKCKKDFIVIEKEHQFPKKEKYFCSMKCANSRILLFSAETRKKISEGIKRKWKDKEYANKCIQHNTLKNKKFTSKTEELIRNYFIEKYSNDKWTFGGILHFKNERLVRDLYSKKLKICVEYDGIWHFKDIHGQLKRKQFKDKVLEEWCIVNNWRLIRISDSYFHSNNDSIKELENLIYNQNEQIIKLYDNFYD